MGCGRHRSDARRANESARLGELLCVAIMVRHHDGGVEEIVLNAESPAPPRLPLDLLRQQFRRSLN